MEILETFTSYFLTNFLIPGSIFIFLNQDILPNTFSNYNIAIQLLLCTFVGIVLSRITSLNLEPHLKESLNIKDEPYEDYLFAKSKDADIEIFLRIKNMYAVFSLIFIILTFKMIVYTYNLPNKENLIMIILYYFLYILFKKSYKRQHNFIAKRIQEKVKGDNRNE